MPDPSRLRVLVVDDHPVVRSGLVTILEAASGVSVIAEAATGTVAVDAFEALRPDVVLLDLRLPDMEGPAVIEAMRAHEPDARIVVITTFSWPEDVRRAVEAGARGYLLKEATAEEIVAAVRSAANGEPVMSLGLIDRLAEAEGLDPLTERERDVLVRLASGASNAEIAQALGISLSTVKIHVSRVLTKLGVRDRTSALLTALRIGLVRLD